MWAVWVCGMHARARSSYLISFSSKKKKTWSDLILSKKKVTWSHHSSCAPHQARLPDGDTTETLLSPAPRLTTRMLPPSLSQISQSPPRRRRRVRSLGFQTHRRPRCMAAKRPSQQLVVTVTPLTRQHVHSARCTTMNGAGSCQRRPTTAGHFSPPRAVAEAGEETSPSGYWQAFVVRDRDGWWSILMCLRTNQNQSGGRRWSPRFLANWWRD